MVLNLILLLTYLHIHYLPVPITFSEGRYTSRRQWKEDALGRWQTAANWTKHTGRLWFWPVCSIMWKHDVIHTSTCYYCIAVRVGPSHGHRWRAENLVKFGHGAFGISEQTDKEITDMLIAIICTPIKGKVIKQHLQYEVAWMRFSSAFNIVQHRFHCALRIKIYHTSCHPW